MRNINSLSFMDYFKPFNCMIIFMVSFLRELYQFQNFKSWFILSVLFTHVSFMIFKTGEYYCLKKYPRILHLSFSSNKEPPPSTLWLVVFGFFLHMLYQPSPRPIAGFFSICMGVFVYVFLNTYIQLNEIITLISCLKQYTFHL